MPSKAQPCQAILELGSLPFERRWETWLFLLSVQREHGHDDEDAVRETRDGDGGWKLMTRDRSVLGNDEKIFLGSSSRKP